MLCQNPSAQCRRDSALFQQVSETVTLSPVRLQAAAHSLFVSVEQCTLALQVPENKALGYYHDKRQMTAVYLLTLDLAV